MTITAQQILDANFQWFIIEQHPPSMGKGSDSCVYRGPNGLKCGIGLVLPDELYVERMDLEGMNSTIAQVLGEYPGVAEFFDGVPVQFLTDIQHAHDFSSDKRTLNEFREEFIWRLKAVAATHQLVWNH